VTALTAQALEAREAVGAMRALVADALHRLPGALAVRAGLSAEQAAMIEQATSEALADFTDRLAPYAPGEGGVSVRGSSTGEHRAGRRLRVSVCVRGVREPVWFIKALFEYRQQEQVDTDTTRPKPSRRFSREW